MPLGTNAANRAAGSLAAARELVIQDDRQIALDQVRRARERGIPPGVVLADAGYGTDSGFRAELTKLEMTYVVGIQSTTTVWKPGKGPKPVKQKLQSRFATLRVRPAHRDY
jgi:SRSO17 transposase